MRKGLDDENIGCEFFELTKSFWYCWPTDTGSNLKYYGIRGVSSDWFKSYLSNHNQYVSINRYESDLAALNCGFTHRSVLGPLLFLLYINDLNQGITLCKVHHFADDTNLLCLSKFI